MNLFFFLSSLLVLCSNPTKLFWTLVWCAEFLKWFLKDVLLFQHYVMLYGTADFKTGKLSGSHLVTWAHKSRELSVAGSRQGSRRDSKYEENLTCCWLAWSWRGLPDKECSGLRSWKRTLADSQRVNGDLSPITTKN